MKPHLPSSRIKVVLIFLLTILAFASFFYNQFLLNRIMEQEKANVELWAKALEFTNLPENQQLSMDLLTLIEGLEQNPTISDRTIDLLEDLEATYTESDFVFNHIIIPEDRFNIPTLIVNENGEIETQRFIDEEDISPETVKRFGQLYDPIEITFNEGTNPRKQYIYYGEGPMIRYLRFFPYLQFGILALLLGVGYITYRSITKSEQSNLWVGMAKEAAHQLGTPLSSLYGWVQLLKDNDKGDPDSLSYIFEIENDIARLRGVAERFNKIGSQPELQSLPVEPILDQVVVYMEKRVPRLGKKVDILKSIRTDAKANLNPELFQWAVENLIKNSMDAIKKTSKNAYVSISLFQEGDQLILEIKDSGSGMTRNEVNQIFKPGYSTKKRGWGLGLSLTRRIIEEYHKGKVFVYESEPGKGTTFRIVLPV